MKHTQFWKVWKVATWHSKLIIKFPLFPEMTDNPRKVKNSILLIPLFSFNQQISKRNALVQYFFWQKYPKIFKLNK